MQNKGIVICVAVLLTLASIFYLSFSFATRYYDSEAAKIKDPIAVNIALSRTLHPCVTYIKFRISQEQGSDNRERQDYQEPCIYSRRLHITLKEINNGQNTKDYFCNLQVYPILMQPEVRHGHNNKLQ